MDKSDVQAERDRLAKAWVAANTELDRYLAQKDDVLAKLRAKKLSLSKEAGAMRSVFLLHGLEPIKLRKDPVQNIVGGPSSEVQVAPNPKKKPKA